MATITQKYDGGDEAYALAIDRKGHVWVAGQTKSSDFPVTPGAVGRKLAGESDAFVSQFDADLKNLLASTYLGGGQNERANAIVIDKQGHAFVGGWSDSSDMLVFLEGNMVVNLELNRSVFEGDDSTDSDKGDGFIARFDTNLTTRISSSLFGGSSLEYIDAILLRGDKKDS